MKTTIYQYVFYDREVDTFSHIESRDLDELNHLAYSAWLDAIENYKQDDQIIEYLPFETYHEFESDDRHYLGLADIGGLEGERFKIEI